MITRRGAARGFSLVELMVTVVIFSVVSMLLYSTFQTITRNVTSVSADNSLAEKGHRILAFIEEDIRMAGFLLGPDAQIPYCPGADDGTGQPLPARSPVLSHSVGNPYDSLTFITSTPVELSEAPECRNLFIPGAGAQSDCASGDPSSAGGDRIDYYLTTRCASAFGGASVAVDAAATCYDGIAPEAAAARNGRSLVTFNSLSLSGSSVAAGDSRPCYTLASVGTKLTMTEPLQQEIPDGSTVYGVRMYRYAVKERSLRRIGWDKACATGAAVTSDLVAAVDPVGNAGGVDALRFEFSTLDPISNTLISQRTVSSLSGLKTVTVWLLLRSDKADRDYTDTKSYTLGAGADRITLGPYRDHYRRLLLRKTVEVKNLAYIN